MKRKDQSQCPYHSDCAFFNSEMSDSRHAASRDRYCYGDYRRCEIHMLESAGIPAPKGMWPHGEAEPG